MHYAHYTKVEQPSYRIVVLTTALQPKEIKAAYLDPYGLNPDEVLVISLFTEPNKKKTSQGLIKRYITEELIQALSNVQAEYLIVTDADYFKALTRKPTAEPNLGYVLDSVYGPWKVVYAPAHRMLFYDPDKTRLKIDQAINALRHHAEGKYLPPGKNIIKSAEYPKTLIDIERALCRLMSYPALTCDIETFSLKPPTAGIGTITFCWNQHEGIAFPVDFLAEKREIRKALRQFFCDYRGKLIFHRATFDIHILIYQLFMQDLLDTKGLLHGLQIICRDWECSQIITYLATNSCAGNELSLKIQAQEFAGNYALTDIKDITKIPLDELLEYNLVDGLSTWFVWNKHLPTAIQDEQIPVYMDIFKPAAIDIIQMQLTGAPVDMEKVKTAKAVLQKDEAAALTSINQLKLTAAYTRRLDAQWVIKRNKELKIKQIKLGDEPQQFNPNSGPQLQDFLYEFLKLPIISRTDSGLPATDKDTLKALRNHTRDPDVIALLNGLLDYSAVSKILTSVIPALEGSFKGADGWHYMLGNFNIGGTLSGRLSSSDPNLQNLPASGTKYAKLIKECFAAPPGWIFVGLDFDSLEDKISALTTKDPNKLKVYTDGFDGHALRASYYFENELIAEGLTIDITDPSSVNQLKMLDHPLRQKSKAPTFALTYQGTKNTLMVNCGFSPELAQDIFERYHQMYAVSTKWVNDQLNQASRNGYVTIAFGLRLRTPLLAQSIRGTKKTPYEVEAEGRTAGNALGQSWCLLNSRAGSEFMGKVRQGKFRLDIRPSLQIHDAQYYLIRDNIDTLLYCNEHVVKAASWQEDPLIEHPDVKLSGTLVVLYPSWAKETKIPNNATQEQVFAIVKDLISSTKPS